MCETCWVDYYGRAAIDTSEVREVARAVARLYEADPVGGRAHIVTDDWNLRDSDIETCIAGPHWSDNDPVATERAMHALQLMLTLSEEERASALALQSGYWS